MPKTYLSQILAFCLICITAQLTYAEPTSIAIASVDFDRVLKEWKKAVDIIRELDAKQAELTKQLEERKQAFQTLQDEVKTKISHVQKAGGEQASKWLKDELAQKIKDLQKSQADGAQWERDHIGTLSQDRVRIIMALLKEVQDTVSRSPETAKFSIVLNRYAGLPGQLPIFLHVDNNKITDLTPAILSALSDSNTATATSSK
jgi:Skp family chaperone for outer membrane proteins